MDTLTQKQREAIESWDEDVDFEGIDDLHFRHPSTTTIESRSRRDSVSSRMSARSDGDSFGAGDEDWQVLLPVPDEQSTADAISSAKSAGIPIPKNVPASALLGGTIKRLGGRKLKKVLGDDWSEDLELPRSSEGALALKRKEAGPFPDSLRDFSGDFPTSPTLPSRSQMSFADQLASATQKRTGALTLGRFKDDDDDDFFGDVPTIKVAKNRSPQKLTEPFSESTKARQEIDDIEDDFELPKDGKPLKLSVRKDEPRTPASNLTDDFDLDWAESSLGTRFGGTRRDIRSNPSSSISAFSPSASSCLTAESEDDGLEGLILPHANFKFGEALKKRVETASKGIQDAVFDNESPVRASKTKPPAQEDFASDFDIGDGEVFDRAKLTLNRNIKQKASKPTSPSRRPATTLTFTNKIEPGVSRIPRYQFHDRQRSTLESVSETGPAPQYRRSVSRLAGASPQPAANKTTSTPSHNAAPSTPSRRGLSTKTSQDLMRSPNTTHPAQYLKAKRSMPVMSRNQAAPSRPPPYQRPPSRGQSRPKTPVDRSGAESSMSNARKNPAPFLPAGTPHTQSHHISVKSSRNFHRPSSSDSNDAAGGIRPFSRLSQAQRAGSPTKARHAPEALMREATSKRPLTKPTRRRAFGDGNELEIFDDLPTSASSESKYIKQPVGRGAPKAVQNRSRLGMQHANTSSASVSEQGISRPPSTPLSPNRNESVPRFARDTNASRLAREQRIGSVSATLHNNANLSTTRETVGLTPLAVNRHPQALNVQKGNLSPMPHTKRRGKGPPQKPRLIKPLGEIHNQRKEEKGMQWNPNLFRWEGNENVLAPFDVPSISPRSLPKSSNNSATKAAPALIANVGTNKGVQMSGGMVFDPQRMCWLKAAPSAKDRSEASPRSSTFNMDEDDDPFAGIEDLEDKAKSAGQALKDDDVFKVSGDSTVGASVNESTSKEELEPLVIGEEFDVGPEFVKRLRAEEERWRTRVAAWVGAGVGRDDDDGVEWKWAIRAKAKVGREE